MNPVYKKRRCTLQTKTGEGARKREQMEELTDGGMDSEIQTMRASCKHDGTFMTLT